MSGAESRLFFRRVGPRGHPEGSAFDLPVASGILVGTGQLDGNGCCDGYALLSELGLDGGLRPVRGAERLLDVVRVLEGAAELPTPQLDHAHWARLVARMDPPMERSSWTGEL